MPTKRTRLTAAVIAAIAAFAVIISGVPRRPAGDAAGGPVVAAGHWPTTGPARLRLAAWNIHSGVGADQRRDLQRTADLLNSFDLICLNEVRGSGAWTENQAEDLARRLQMQTIFAPTERQWWRDSFGNAALSNRTIQRWQRTQLRSGPRMAQRNVLLLYVPFGSETLHVLMTHVGRKADRQPQLSAVAEMFLKLPAPAVLMGDMNTPPGDATMRRLLESGDVEDPISRRVPQADASRIDFILLRGLVWTDAGLIDNNASDHPLVWVEVQSARDRQGPSNGSAK